MTIHGPENAGPSPGPEKFEELLTEHLSAVLEPERGKALAAFRGRVSVEGDTLKRVLRTKSGRDISRRELWMWTGLPSLVAACLAVVVTLQVLRPKVDGGPGDSGINGKMIVVDSPQMNQLEVTQRATGGVVVSNDTPMRPIQERTIRQYQWLDTKDNATYTLTQPVEKAGYIQVQPF